MAWVTKFSTALRVVRNRRGLTPLVGAAIWSREASVELLLASRADATTVEEYYGVEAALSHPLVGAAAGGSWERLESSYRRGEITATLKNIGPKLGTEKVFQ